jgi:hypothetical protein
VDEALYRPALKQPRHKLLHASFSLVSSGRYSESFGQKAFSRQAAVSIQVQGRKCGIGRWRKVPFHQDKEENVTQNVWKKEKGVGSRTRFIATICCRKNLIRKMEKN